MAAYARAHVMRNASVEIDEVEYANQVTTAMLTPDTPIQTLRTLVPDGTIQDVDSPAWTFSLSGVQDYGTNGLAKALNTAALAGDAIEIVLQPKVGTGQDVATFTIIPVSVAFGGEQGAFRTFEAEFPVVGQPVFTQSV